MDMLQIDIKQIPGPRDPAPRVMHKLEGERGLVLAIIWRAWCDLRDNNQEVRETAVAYFSSERYRHHLELCGLEPSFLPQGVSRVQ